MAIDQIASRADLAFLDFTRPSAKQINFYLTDLQAQLSFPDISDTVDLTERFMFLDVIMTMDGHGVGQLIRDGERGEHQAMVADILTQDALTGIDWNPALEIGNRCFDRMAAAMRRRTRTERMQAWPRTEMSLCDSRRQPLHQGVSID